MAKEGSLEAPTRHPIAWRDEAFYDTEAIEAEMTRVFDICHGCRRCFNLCESFPKLFDFIDESETFEVDGLEPAIHYKEVADACTLCDMCFMTKCPYVPPHEFDLDFPHLILRYRAAEHRAGKTDTVVRQLAETDRNGASGEARCAPVVNWGGDRKNNLVRGAMQSMLGIDKHVELPRYHSKTLVDRADGLSTPNPGRESRRAQSGAVRNLLWQFQPAAHR